MGDHTDHATGEQRGRLILRWGVGMALTSVRYLFHRVPFYRRNRRPGCTPDIPDLDRELPGDAGTIQRAADGIGPLYHRRYEIAFTDSDLTCEELILRLRQEPNTAALPKLSSFDPVDPDWEGPLDVGDEMVVRLPGPWNGPVRVIDVTPSSYRLVTLDGHMEAGEIEFRADVNERGWIVFMIESWARAGDPLFNLLYHRLPVARELQLHMWSHLCERVAALAGGVVMTNVELHSCTEHGEPAPA